MRCAYCRSAVRLTENGLATRRYCSSPCRQAAYRKRQRRKRRPHADPCDQWCRCDNVSTPCALAKRIVGHYQPRGRVLDPCRGDAQPFYKVLLKQPRCSVDWCEIGEGGDFLRYNQKVDWIISNPPWSKILVFIKHALATR
jgi:hypothetical protein